MAPRRCFCQVAGETVEELAGRLVEASVQKSVRNPFEYEAVEKSDEEAAERRAKMMMDSAVPEGALVLKMPNQSQKTPLHHDHHLPCYTGIRSSP